MKSFVIDKKSSLQRADKFVMRICPNLSFSMICKYFRLKRIKVNKKRCEINYILQENDVIELYINDEFFDVPIKTIDNQPTKSLYKIEKIIVYEDENILILNKPVGLLCHSNQDKKVENLTDIFLNYYNEKNLSYKPVLCNRIDRNTCGLVIVAKNYLTTNLINTIIKKRYITKEYFCVVYSTEKVIEQGIKKAYISYPQDNKAIISNNKTSNSKEIITEFVDINQNNNLHLFKVTLHTGRKHQIRAHLSSLGLPIVGDEKYGNCKINKELNEKYQLLCSYSIKFDDNLSEKLSSDHLDYLNNKKFICPEPFFIKKYNL